MNDMNQSGSWCLGSKAAHAQLPPKSPWMISPLELDVPDNNANQNGFPSWFDHFQQQAASKHQRTNASIGFVQNSQSVPWMMDEIPDSTIPKRDALHRRSASDSIAFVDAQLGGSFLPQSENVEGDSLDGGSSSAVSIPSRGSFRDFDKLDEEQLLSMFEDIEPFQQQQEQQHKLPNGSACLVEIGLLEGQATHDAPSTPSDHNSICEQEEKPLVIPSTQIKAEQEAQSNCNVDQPQQKNTPTLTFSAKDNGDAGYANSNSGVDPNIDPKRVKRILANRQSAQRSRVRKLQYISELERSVNSLQAEVSTLSPQVAYLDHQRLLLNVDNSALKQRIAALAQDKVFKDAQCEALRKEVNRLRQFYQQQCLPNQGNQLPSMNFENGQQNSQSSNGANGVSSNGADGNRQYSNLECRESGSATDNSNGANPHLFRPMNCLTAEKTTNNMAFSADQMVHNT